MSQTEKQSLINSITLCFAEDYGLNVKETKAKLAEILQHYHVKITDEPILENDQSTEYLLKVFAEGKKSAGMKEATIKQYIIAVQTLEKYTGKRLSDIEPEDLTKFLIEYGRTVSSVTLRGKYQLLSSVYNYLFSRRLIATNPILFIDAPKQTIIYKTPMSELDLEKIIDACEKLPQKESIRNMAMLYTFISTGCRVSELANIKIKDLDLTKKTIKVLGKGKKERPVILTDKAIFRVQLYFKQRSDLSPEAPLFAHIRGKEESMTKDAIEREIKKMRELAGVDKVTCHTFRRFYATELRRRNVNIQMIATSLGHANLNQINRYSLYNNVEMLDTIRSCM